MDAFHLSHRVLVCIFAYIIAEQSLHKKLLDVALLPCGKFNSALNWLVQSR